MADTTKLFAGEPAFFGGLSNEQELVAECPAEFKDTNPWSDLASNLFFGGGSIGHWKWKTTDPEVKRRQMACCIGITRTFGVSHQDKEAVAGWMLSEMLAELPEYIPPKKKEE